MVPNIDIVTCFYDIGRGSWSNGPSYLKRTTDDYMKSFERLCGLKNRIIVYTSVDLEEQIRDIARNSGNKNVYVIARDIFSEYRFILDRIKQIQDRPDYRNGISQIWNPEYWSPEYVLVNYLKATFVNDAIDNHITSNDLVSWIDFGYCRNNDTILTNKWRFNFDKTKIHLWKNQSVPRIERDADYLTRITEIIKNNDVYIQGCHIVADRRMWFVLKNLMLSSYFCLQLENLMDDDQTLLYMSYNLAPELFMLHNNEGEWFTIFKEFNDA